MRTREKARIIRDYIARNGTRFSACGCLVWRQAYITVATRKSGTVTKRLRCRRHHRKTSAVLMRKTRVGQGATPRRDVWKQQW